MKYVVACMAVVGLGLWACGGGGADVVGACEDAQKSVDAVYEECGITTGVADLSCSSYETGYDDCSNGDEIADDFKKWGESFTCDTATSTVDSETVTITSCSV